MYYTGNLRETEVRQMLKKAEIGLNESVSKRRFVYVPRAEDIMTVITRSMNMSL